MKTNPSTFDTENSVNTNTTSNYKYRIPSIQTISPDDDDFINNIEDVANRVSELCNQGEVLNEVEDTDQIQI